MENKLIISTSPHLHSGASTRRIMLDVLIALTPAAIAAVVLFGWSAAVLIAVSVISAVGSEFVFNLICKQQQTIGDLSAAVTGLLLALTLPVSAETVGNAWWQVMLGAIFAIVVVKCLFGGIGCNFANPAITGRIFMLICFPETGKAIAPLFGKLVEGTAADGTLVSGATPLGAMGAGVGAESLPSLLDMLLGNRGGAIGESCIIALVLGGIYLLARKVIAWHTPVVYIGATFLLSLVFCGDALIALYHVLAGGLVIGAFFMATDYSTTPLNKWGKAVFALGCAIITVIIRFFANYPEGVSFAILIMNILSPYIEKLCAPKPLGAAGKKGGKA